MNFIKEYKNSVSKKLCENIIQKNLDTNLNVSLKEKEINFKNDFWGGVLNPVFQIASKNIKNYFSFYKQYTEDMADLTHVRFMHHKEFFFMNLHYDSELEFINQKDCLRTFIVLVYLNEGYENGELVFPIQKFKITPKTGLMVIFPTSFMYPHLTTPAIGCDRYVLQLSYHINKNIFFNKNYDFH